MGEHLRIVGAGGHGRETLAIALAQNADQARKSEKARWVIDGFVDDATAPEAPQLPYPPLGTVAWCASQSDDTYHALAIGDPATRALVAERLGSRRYATLIHPGAEVGPDVRLGDGAIIAANATLTTTIELGPHAHVNPGVVVSHDVVIGSFVSCSPGVLLCGNVTIGNGVLLGAGAVVLPGCRVGDGAIVGAGAIVVDDVASNAVVVGNPARPISDNYQQRQPGE